MYFNAATYPQTPRYSGKEMKGLVSRKDTIKKVEGTNHSFDIAVTIKDHNS